MKDRRIFTVGKDVHFTAGKLGQAFYGEEANVVAIENENCFAGMVGDDFQQLLFLGHGSPYTYGGYFEGGLIGKLTGGGFVNILADRFKEKNEESKNAVKDIYLVGCEIGLMDENGRSVAQDIANELYDKGFRNKDLKVHAVARTRQNPNDSLYVEVLTNLGAAQKASNNLMKKDKSTKKNKSEKKKSQSGEVKEGYISAFVFNKQDSEEYDGLMAFKKTNMPRIRELEKNALKVIQNENPHFELDTNPNNIFIPNESLKIRQERINNSDYAVCLKQKNQALDLLRLQREHENKKSKNDLVGQLDSLISKLDAASPMRWKSTIVEWKHHFDTKIGPINLSFNSSTVKLLNDLIEGKIISNPEVTQNNKHNNNEIVREEIKSKTKKENIGKKHKQNKEDDNGKGTMPLEIYDVDVRVTRVKKIIEKMDAKYTKQIDALRKKTHCFSFFTDYEIKTKIEKQNALRMISNQNDFKVMQNVARNYSDNDSRVMRDSKTHITKDFLDIIVNQENELLESQDDAEKLKEAKRMIQQTVNHYNEAIKQLNSGCCGSFFYSYERNTKIQKRDALKELLNHHTFGSLQRRAREYMDNSRVMKSSDASAITRTLLEAIVNGPLTIQPKNQDNIIIEI